MRHSVITTPVALLFSLLIFPALSILLRQPAAFDGRPLFPESLSGMVVRTVQLHFVSREKTTNESELNSLLEQSSDTRSWLFP